MKVRVSLIFLAGMVTTREAVSIRTISTTSTKARTSNGAFQAEGKAAWILWKILEPWDMRRQHMCEQGVISGYCWKMQSDCPEGPSYFRRFWSEGPWRRTGSVMIGQDSLEVDNVTHFEDITVLLFSARAPRIEEDSWQKVWGVDTVQLDSWLACQSHYFLETAD